jgi:hypothetical protein
MPEVDRFEQLLAQQQKLINRYRILSTAVVTPAQVQRVSSRLLRKSEHTWTNGKASSYRE